MGAETRDADGLATLLVSKVDSVAEDVRELRRDIENIRVGMARFESDRERLVALTGRVASLEVQVQDTKLTIAKWAGAVFAASTLVGFLLKFVSLVPGPES